MVSLDGYMQPGMAYVALSRVTTLQGLWLLNFNEKKLVANPEAQIEMWRLKYGFTVMQPVNIQASGAVTEYMSVIFSWMANCLSRPETYFKDDYTKDYNQMAAFHLDFLAVVLKCQHFLMEMKFNGPWSYKTRIFLSIIPVLDLHQNNNNTLFNAVSVWLNGTQSLSTLLRGITAIGMLMKVATEHLPDVMIRNSTCDLKIIGFLSEAIQHPILVILIKKSQFFAGIHFKLGGQNTVEQTTIVLIAVESSDNQYEFYPVCSSNNEAVRKCIMANDWHFKSSIIDKKLFDQDIIKAQWEQVVPTTVLSTVASHSKKVTINTKEKQKATRQQPPRAAKKAQKSGNESDESSESPSMTFSNRQQVPVQITPPAQNTIDLMKILDLNWSGTWSSATNTCPWDCFLVTMGAFFGQYPSMLAHVAKDGNYVCEEVKNFMDNVFAKTLTADEARQILIDKLDEPLSLKRTADGQQIDLYGSDRAHLIDNFKHFGQISLEVKCSHGTACENPVRQKNSATILAANRNMNTTAAIKKSIEEDYLFPNGCDCGNAYTTKPTDSSLFWTDQSMTTNEEKYICTGVLSVTTTTSYHFQCQHPFVIFVDLLDRLGKDWELIPKQIEILSKKYYLGGINMCFGNHFTSLINFNSQQHKFYYYDGMQRNTKFSDVASLHQTFLNNKKMTTAFYFLLP